MGHMWDTLKRSNTCATGVPEKEEKMSHSTEKLAENSPTLIKDKNI